MPTINNIECYLSPADIESFNTTGKLVGGDLEAQLPYQYLMTPRRLDGREAQIVYVCKERAEYALHNGKCLKVSSVLVPLGGAVECESRACHHDEDGDEESSYLQGRL